MSGNIIFKTKQDNVSVFLNEKYVGITSEDTPLEVTGLDPGKYYFRMSSDKYEDFLSELKVYDNKITQVTFNFEKHSENIEFNNINISTPTPTPTPTSIPVPMPTPISKTISVPEASSSIPESIKTGSILLECAQHNANIILNGNYEGETPLLIEDIEIGKYFFTLSLSGYDDFSSELNVYENKITKVYVDIELHKESRDYEDITSSSHVESESIDSQSQPLGAINFDSQQDKVAVTLEGDYVGETPLDLVDMKTGRFLYTMSLAGYEDFFSELNVYDGKITKVYVDLELHKESRDYEDIIPVTQTDQTQTPPAPEDISIEQHLADMNEILTRNNDILDQLNTTMDLIRQYIETTNALNPDQTFFNTDQLAISVDTPNQPSGYDVIADPTSSPPLPGYDRVMVYQVLDRNAPELHVTNAGSTNLYAIVSHDGVAFTSSEATILRGEIKHFYNVYELRIRGPVVGNLNPAVGQEPGGIYSVTEYPSQLDFNNLNKPAIFVNSATVPAIATLLVTTFVITGDIINLTSTFRSSPINTDFVFYTYQGGNIFNPLERGILAPGDVMRVNGTRGMQVTFAGNSAGQIIELTTETDLSI